MIIQLNNKNVFDSGRINQIQKILFVQNLILDGGKQIPVTDLELEWILRVCGHIVYVNADLSFNTKSIVALDEQPNSYLVTLRNGFTFSLTKPQVVILKNMYEKTGHKVIDLNARAAELTALGISKNDCQKLA